MTRFLRLLLIFFISHGYICSLMKLQCEKPDWFRCKDGGCISVSLVCDGVNDCGDNSDEKNCTGFTTTPSPTSCKADEFRCLDNLCIPNKSVCDGTSDCLDHSDEILGCMKNITCDGFECKNHHCIMREWRCDGQNDCGDNSDELNCSPEDSVPISECTVEKRRYLCENTKCVSLDKVCDGTPDCDDGTDEDTKKCASAILYCNNPIHNHCDHICLSTPRGPTCLCRTGYTLRSNGTCLDIDECQNYGVCDQICVNTLGSYKCTCADGYEMQSETCKAKGGEALMVFSSKTELRGFFLISHLYFPLVRNLQHVVGVSVDADYIYWSDIALGDEAIVRSPTFGQDKEVIVTAGLSSPEEIAVDWVTGNVYFTDSQLKHIGVCTNQGSHCTVVITEYADKPRGLALMPSKGEMYWSDWGVQPHISKATMDGKDTVQFITEKISWPNGLAIDYPNERLYWVDAKLKIIESIRLDGRDRRVVLHKVAKHPYSIAIFENTLYWSDWETKSIESCNKFSGKEHSVLMREKNVLYGIHIYHSALKPKIPNPCKDNPCTHICLLSRNQTYSCACSMNMELSRNDQRTCKPKTKSRHLLIATGTAFIDYYHEILGKPKLIENSTGLKLVMGLAYNSLTGAVFVSDKISNAIFRKDMKSGKSDLLISAKHGRIGGLDFDYLGNNLYWCDMQRKMIVIRSFATDEDTVLNYSEEPHDVLVLPKSGVMFVVFRSKNVIHIDKLEMTGLGPHTHVVETSILGPKVTLAYDDELRMVYWADQGTGRIESTSVEGTERHLFRTGLHGPVSLAILGNEVFWTLHGSKKLYWADKFNVIQGNKRITLQIPDGLNMINLLRLQEIYGGPEHECSKNNGGCSHVCLVTITNSHLCSCPPEMILGDDRSTCRRKTTCNSDELKCIIDGACINSSLRCNGVSDCLDGTDERNCSVAESICSSVEFKCKISGECISSSGRCNSNYDCKDHSDEFDCDEEICKADEFRCTQGNCISKYFMCDGKDDCADSSDEENCNAHTCDSNSFECATGHCIPKLWECDGQIDCSDGSDEGDKCPTKTCRPDMFSCDNGHCVDALLECNTEDDCGDNSDENHCPGEEKTSSPIPHECTKDEYRCYGTNVCLPSSVRCNGKQDCPKNDDEHSCDVCEEGEFACENRKCIPRIWVCDKADDCGDKSDEKHCKAQNSSSGAVSVDLVHCSEYTCTTGTCLSWSNVCDGIKDCSDGSDEGGQCDIACEKVNPCEAVCQKTPGGSVCSCPEGFRLRKDGATCEDIDECEQNTCSQRCANLPGSYHCFCFYGYILRNDGISCKAAEHPMEIIAITDNDIRKISSMVNSVEVIHHEPHVGISGFDVDAQHNSIYWSSRQLGTINKLSLNGNGRKIVTGVGKPEALATDWVTKNIYFYDSEEPHAIKACNLEEQKYAKIRSIDESVKVLSLVVAPTEGWLYWSQTSWWLSNSPHSEIYRTDMTGSNSTLIAYKNLGKVSGMTIDHERSSLYWADATKKMIERSDLNGANREVVFETEVSEPMGLSLYEDTLYWLIGASGKLKSCRLYGNRECQIMQVSANALVKYFAILHIARQPWAQNSCQNHECDHFCVPRYGRPTCLCADGQLIQANAKCNEEVDTNIKFSTKQRNIRQEGNAITGILISLTMGIAILFAYFYYRRKKLNLLSKHDLSIHFQNPSFGRTDTRMNSYVGVVLPTPGEHEYFNPIDSIPPKIHEEEKKEIHERRTVEPPTSDYLQSESESEDMGYSHKARLITKANS